MEDFTFFKDLERVATECARDYSAATADKCLTANHLQIIRDGCEARFRAELDRAWAYSHSPRVFVLAADLKKRGLLDYCFMVLDAPASQEKSAA